MSEVETKIKMLKCVKCGKKKLPDDFGFNYVQTAKGRIKEPQSYCKECKAGLSKKRREINVAARIKHHMMTRIEEQLQDLVPQGMAAELDKYLDYRIISLVRHLTEELKEREGKKLRAALQEGYHIDHIRPLSSFNVTRTVIKGGNKIRVIDWDEFKKCWAIENQRAISAEENLAKGAKWDGNTE